jgi:hypothetical protein
MAVTLITSGVITILFLTAFRDDPFLVGFQDITQDSAAGPAFAVAVAAGVQALFGQVAHGATIVAVAGVAARKNVRLVDALDPAFSRLGALITQAVMFVAAGAVLVASVFGVALIPYVYGRLAVSSEALMLEQRSVIQSFGRSWRLMRGRLIRFWAAFLRALLIVFIPLALSALVGLLEPGGRTTTILAVFAADIIGAILLIPVAGVITGVTTLYFLKAKELES